MTRAVNVILGVRFQMMIAMIPHPRDRIARQRNRRAGGKDELQPTRHLKAAMGKVAMQVKSRAETAPDIDREHDREVTKMKVSPERSHAQKLEEDENAKNSDIELFVSEHNKT